jgi:hypothetical protein
MGLAAAAGRKARHEIVPLQGRIHGHHYDGRALAQFLREYRFGAPKKRRFKLFFSASENNLPPLKTGQLG